MKRAYMFNLDDFMRIGGHYELVSRISSGANYVTGIYRLFLDGEESLADVDVYTTGARMVKYREDANYELFAKAGERRLNALEDNQFVFLTRNFLLAIRMVFMGFFLVVCPVLSLFMMTQEIRPSFVIFCAISLVAGICLYRIKPLIWSVMNIANNDLVLIERSVFDEKTE